MSWIESGGGGGIATGSDATLGDVTADSITLDAGGLNPLWDVNGIVLTGNDVLRWNAGGGNRPITMQAENAGVLTVEKGDDRGGWRIAVAEQELTGLSGASVATTNLVPAGGRILGVTIRVTTTITGATSIDIGDGADVDRYGAGIALTAGTTTDHGDATADPMSWSAAAQDVTLTANGSSFTAGAVRVVAIYVGTEPPGS